MMLILMGFFPSSPYGLFGGTFVCFLTHSSTGLQADIEFKFTIYGVFF